MVTESYKLDGILPQDFIKRIDDNISHRSYCERIRESRVIEEETSSSDLPQCEQKSVLFDLYYDGEILHITLKLLKDTTLDRRNFLEASNLCELLSQQPDKQDGEYILLRTQDKRSAGAHTLLCNYWAYAEELLGRQPDLNQYVQLHRWEREKKQDPYVQSEIDLADPSKSMKNGIKRLREKYRE